MITNTAEKKAGILRTSSSNEIAGEVKRDTEEIRITIEMIRNRGEFRCRIDNFKQFKDHVDQSKQNLC